LKKKGVWNLVETIDLYPAPETSVNEKTFWRFYLNNSANVFHEGKLYYILFNSASQLFDLTLKEFSAYTQMHETQLKIYTIDFNE